MSQGTFAYYCLVTGFVGQSKLMERLTLDWGSVASAAFFLHQNDTETLHKVRKYHFGESDSEITESDYEALTNLVGDRCFVIPTRDAAVLHAKHHRNVPTYLYYFTESGDQSYGDFMYSFSEDSWMPRLLQIFFELLKKFVYRHLNLETFDLGKDVLYTVNIRKIKTYTYILRTCLRRISVISTGNDYW